MKIYRKFLDFMIKEMWLGQKSLNEAFKAWKCDEIVFFPVKILIERCL